MLIKSLTEFDRFNINHINHIFDITLIIFIIITQMKQNHHVSNNLEKYLSYYAES